MNVLSQLKEHAGNYDLQSMDTLVESLSPAEREENRQDIIDAYYEVYSYGMYDLNCSKVNDPFDFTLYLLEIIHTIQRFFPDEMYYSDLGCCYEYLSEYSDAKEDKLRYQQQAIHIYTTAPLTTDNQITMVRVLIDKMEITGQFTTEAFTELLSFFRPLLNHPGYIQSLINQNFRIRFLPFEGNLYWYQLLLREFEAAMYEHAEKDLLVSLHWVEAYQYLLYHDSPEIDAGYKAAMVAQTVLLLKPLEGYYTEDAGILNRLGKAFADTAKRSTDNELSLHYYQAAVDFFTKGHELEPAAWTYPVYATNALLAMAQIYNTRGAYEKLINAFEQGLQLFSQVYQHEVDFSLNLYWGDFLVAYTGLAYNYQSPSINRQAEEKLQLAIALGDNYHARPFYSLARLAIKTGDKEKCVALLQQCKAAIRSRGYTAYNLSDILADEDFREIWDRLQ